MWIVKISGGLMRDPLLPLWLGLMAQLGSGRVTVVCGGGRFGEDASHTNAHWCFDNNLQLHNMSVLAMAQAGYLAASLEPKLRLASSEQSIRQILRAGHTAIWLPLELLKDRPDVQTSSIVGSDLIALDLACRLNAERLILVKSGLLKPAAHISKPNQVDLLHSGFAAMARCVSFPIDIVHSSDPDRMRSLLYGESRAATLR